VRVRPAAMHPTDGLRVHLCQRGNKLSLLVDAHSFSLRSWINQAPSFIANDRRYRRGGRDIPLDVYHSDSLPWPSLPSEAARATNTQQTWRQEFLGSRSSTVERCSTRTAAAGTFLPFFQTIFENTSLWRLKRLVTLST